LLTTKSSSNGKFFPELSLLQLGRQQLYSTAAQPARVAEKKNLFLKSEQFEYLPGPWTAQL
jgi:hypothetical protein